MSTRSTAVAVTLVTLAVGVAACGGDDENEATAQKPATTTTTERQAAPDLARYLMRTGEEPGFRPGAAPGAMPRERDTVTGVKAFVSEMGLPASEARRLTSEGFVAFTVQPIRGPGAAGLSNVALYETAQGAERSMAHDLRPDVISQGGALSNLRFFEVAGVPGARGWTASLPGGQSGTVGNVVWVQGRCMHVLGNQGPGPLPGPLSKGARAIYERTSDRCPCAKP